MSPNSIMGKLFIISGPSGVGKTTICATLCQTVPQLLWSISATTRPKREGEVDGKDYYFISLEDFRQKIRQNEFLEYASVHDNYYGTLRQPVERGLSEGNHYLLEIDVQGAYNVHKSMPESILIFVRPPSIEILRERLITRNRDSLAIIEKRICNAIQELERAIFYDFIVINNNLEQTITEIRTIMQKSIADRNLYV